LYQGAVVSQGPVVHCTLVLVLNCHRHVMSLIRKSKNNDCCDRHSTFFHQMNSKHNSVLAHALQTPSIKKLSGKRIILASNSPRRKEILNTFVRRELYCESL